MGDPGITLTRTLRLGREPDKDAQTRYETEAAAIRGRRRASQITLTRCDRELREAAGRRDRDLRDTRATYTISCEGIGPWRVRAPDGTELPGEYPQSNYAAATAAARAHHSHTFGSGLARGDQYIRINVASNRITGTRLQLLDLEHPDSEYQAQGHRYAARCVNHGTVAYLGSYATIREKLHAPQTWCPPCARQYEAAQREVEETT